jgi:hypothetical protein
MGKLPDRCKMLFMLRAHHLCGWYALSLSIPGRSSLVNFLSLYITLFLHTLEKSLEKESHPFSHQVPSAFFPGATHLLPFPPDIDALDLL